MEITFLSEKLSELAEVLMPMFNKHYEEIAWNKGKIPLNPDFVRYRMLEENNMLRLYVARKDGEIVGYAAFTTTQHLHYNDIKMAQNDVFYVSPEHRGGAIGRQLLAFSEAELKREGVQDISLHIKFSHDWSRLAERWGYEKTDILMHKWVGG